MENTGRKCKTGRKGNSTRKMADVAAEPVQVPTETPVENTPAPETAANTTAPAQNDTATNEVAQDASQPADVPAASVPAAVPTPAPAPTASVPLKQSSPKKIIDDADVSAAKAYLMQTSSNNTSLYDHLTSDLLRVLEQRPSNPLDLFESLSADVKRSKFDVESYDSPANVQVKLK